MEKNDALSMFSALSQPIRLDVFRLLVQAGEIGRSAGEIAQMLDIRQNTLSNNLSILLNSGLVSNRREGRSIRYFANTDGIRGFLGFLLDGCCQNRADLCASVISSHATLLERNVAPREVHTVLFLCTGNSARSLMAEAILNDDPQGRFRAFSAGSQPSAHGPHPLALDLLAERGHDATGLRTKSWDEFTMGNAPDIDFVFTVCDTAAAEICPVWPGQPMSAHWGVPDPVCATGSEAERCRAFARAYETLDKRISTFTKLPVEALDRFTLQKNLDAIGREAA